jgi:hypothetical protein
MRYGRSGRDKFLLESQVNWLQVWDEGLRILVRQTKKQAILNEWPKHLRLP